MVLRVCEVKARSSSEVRGAFGSDSCSRKLHCNRTIFAEVAFTCSGCCVFSCPLPFFKFLKSLSVCVCCFVFIEPILGNRYGPGVIPWGRGPGVAGSSPSTLTTSLVTPVPSCNSSNGPTTTPLTTRGLCPGGSVVWAGPKFVRPHWWES